MYAIITFTVQVARMLPTTGAGVCQGCPLRCCLHIVYVQGTQSAGVQGVTGYGSGVYVGV